MLAKTTTRIHPAGSSSYANSIFTIAGGGSDIWGASDQFNYAYQTLTGDGTIIAHVTSQTNTNIWAKAGVMIRSSTAGSSNFVAAEVTPGNGTHLQYRNSANLNGGDIGAGDLMWKGDSIQLSLDPKLGRTEGTYGPDDYELGVCLSSKTHQAEAVRYSGANAEIVKHLRYAVTRDEARKVTTYEVAIPADPIAGLSLKAGSRLGLNVAIHDADATGVRKQTAEFTPGTSWPKSPSLYQPWTVLD